MFVQVIQGQVSNKEKLRAAFERWMTELAPGTEGWLGSTAGVTEDGRFIALARFENEDLAMRNSSRPEQDRWWSETSKLFTGDVTFRNSSDVNVDVRGNPDDAGFVQVMQGRSTDPERAKELVSGDVDDTMAEFRPDIIGSIGVGHEGGEWTMAIYFTSEAEAREGERKQPPPELAAQMEEMQKLSAGEPTYLDIKDPWLYSPR